jgi:hypothetical protein
MDLLAHQLKLKLQLRKQRLLLSHKWTATHAQTALLARTHTTHTPQLLLQLLPKKRRLLLFHKLTATHAMCQTKDQTLTMTTQETQRPFHLERLLHQQQNPQQRKLKLLRSRSKKNHTTLNNSALTLKLFLMLLKMLSQNNQLFILTPFKNEIQIYYGFNE